MLERLKSPVIMTLCVFILFPNLDRYIDLVLQFEFLESPNALTVSV